MQSNKKTSNKPKESNGHAFLSENLKLKVTFRLINVSGSDVFFKQDGQRFHEKQTLKLATGTLYKVNMEAKPSMELT